MPASNVSWVLPDSTHDSRSEVSDDGEISDGFSDSNSDDDAGDAEAPSRKDTSTANQAPDSAGEMSLSKSNAGVVDSGNSQTGKSTAHRLLAPQSPELSSDRLNVRSRTENQFEMSRDSKARTNRVGSNNATSARYKGGDDSLNATSKPVKNEISGAAQEQALSASSINWELNEVPDDSGPEDPR